MKRRHLSFEIAKFTNIIYCGGIVPVFRASNDKGETFGLVRGNKVLQNSTYPNMSQTENENENSNILDKNEKRKVKEAFEESEHEHSSNCGCGG